ncbi:hypothetical protein [Thiomicrorhabdus sp.]|uniref:hypothetical protein n=1 Tax=Thiomicrorhabdus sp. TaxID=2039724 RepID=UPI003565C594
MKENEQALKQLLSIDDSNHSHQQRTRMIVQGVNWLTLLQEILQLFFYRVPLSVADILTKSISLKEKD